MSNFQHAVFFESKPLNDSEKEKIKRYFQKRRVSGGGECGLVELIGHNTYRINFMEEEVQERVLGKKQHVIPLPDGGQMSVSLSQNNVFQNPTEPQASGEQQMSPSEDKKELEKTFPMNTYLLRYLKDSPKAARVLKKQLLSIKCSAQLHPEEEVAVVRGEVEKGLDRASQVAEKWELQVDKVFIALTESYSYRFELDSARLKVLMDNPSFQTEDLRVYMEEGGYAVIVGEVGEVEDKMKMLEEGLHTTKECPVPQGQYDLVEEEFKKEINTQCPKVKISRNSSSTVLLEGPVKDVELGSTKLDSLMKSTKRKTVCFPKPLLDFMKSSGAINKYQVRFKQSLRSPVALEAHSDLVLASLSPEALEEAAVTVQRDLGVETLKLEGTVALLPALNLLKEALSKAKAQANNSSPRVEVIYQSGPSDSSKTEVQLVGYSDAVSKLKDVILDFKINQVEIQEQLILPHSKMVDYFDKILALIGMKPPGVKLTASPSPSPSVLLSGPRCLVQEAREALSSALACLTWEKLVLDGPGACQYFQGEGKRSVELVENSCQVLIREQQQSTAGISGTQGAAIQKVNTGRRQSTRPHDANRRTGSQAQRTSPNATNSLVNQVGLEVHLGSLEEQQVDVLVVPMVNSQLTSTMIGSCLLRKAGIKLKTDFDTSTKGHSLAPGEVVVVDPTPSLGCCSKIIFIQCLPFDAANGASVMALQTGLRRALELCGQQGLRSVALPVIGLGLLLKYPLRMAVEVLTDEIGRFGQTGLTGSVLTVRVVIKPDSPESSQVFQYVFSGLSSNMVNWRGEAMFKSLTSDLDEITVAVGGGINLQLVFGDITNETTDAVVNTTDFVDFQTAGVCRDILTMAGPQLETELRSARVARGEVLVTQPGQFPCQAILHACGQRDAIVIQGLVGEIVKKCEIKRLTSVAVPAICEGEGGLHPEVVAGAILQGVKATISSTPLHSLALIRIILNKIKVFQAFKVTTQKLFPLGAIPTASPTDSLSAAQSLQFQPPSPYPLAPDLSSLLYTFSSSVTPSEFLILGLSDKDVALAKAELQRLYQASCSQHSFTLEELTSLGLEDVDELGKQVEALGLCVEQNQGQGGKHTQGGWTVKGPKDRVSQMVQVVQHSLHGSLRRMVKEKEEDSMYAQVAWCILRTWGDWERLPKAANYMLETGDIGGGVVDGQGAPWKVDLSKMEVTGQGTRQVAKLKRLENLPDFPLPLYWDNMATGENLVLVNLPSTSEEYRRLKADFKRTATMTVLKIERVQNVHLRRAYEVRKKHVANKSGNDQGAGEKALYHGTTHDNCQSIIGTGFDWRCSGQNATVYGQGTYFALDASYSANPTYSKPSPDGSRLMFVARVLTGTYTQGDSTMRVPPARPSQQPSDRYDSVVNNIQNPSMFVVFNDSAAYPDYLITFK